MKTSQNQIWQIDNRRKMKRNSIPKLCNIHKIPLICWTWTTFLKACDLHNVEKHRTKCICSFYMGKELTRNRMSVIYFEQIHITSMRNILANKSVE